MRTLTTIEWVRPPTDHGVDRPDVEAQQCVELTGTNRPRACHTTKQDKQPQDDYLSSARVHCTISQTTNIGIIPHTPGVGRQHKNVSVAIAQGKRPVPFRTRKLSLAAPMVLHPPGCGRVGHRRTHPPQGGDIEGPNHTVRAFSHPQGQLIHPMHARFRDAGGAR